MNKHLLDTKWLIMASLLVAGASAARADEVTLKLSECPAQVQQTFVAEAKGAHPDSVLKETEDESTIYGAFVTIGGKHYEITVAEDGTLIEKSLDEETVESEVAFTNVPAAVQKTLREEAEGAEIETLDKTSEGDKAFYEVGAAIDGRNYWLMVDQHGRLLEKRLGFEIEQDQIDFDEAPAAVQKTFKRIAKGAEVATLQKITENAKSEFDAVVAIDGRQYAIRVGEEGVLIEKSLDVEPEEEEIKLSSAPAAVQRTLRDEARGADLATIVKKTEGDDVLYGVSIKLGAKAYWIVVNPAGVLMSKELDEK
jgi:ribosomal protein L21